jgi:HEAT repeat protein
MKRFGYLLLVLLVALACEGRKQKKALKNGTKTGTGKGDIKLPSNDPLWEELEQLTKEPNAAKEGVCSAIAYLNNDRGRKILAACLDPIISEPKENVELRRSSMELIALINATDGIPSLKRAVADNKAEIRGKAGEALIRMKDASGAEALLSYKGGYNSDHGGIFWLIQYAEVLPKDFAIKGASNQEDTARKNSAILLGLVGGDEALALVSDLAIDPDKDIQTYARKVNFILSDAQVLLEELKKDLKSKNKTTRFIAVEMLGYYGKNFGDGGADVRTALGAALSDTDAVVQTKAVESLSLLGGPESNAILIARLPTADGALAGRILSALVELKDPSKIDEVLAYADKADLNSRGVDLANCFVAYKDKKAIGFSQKLIASPTPYLHRAGAKMVASLGAEEAIWKPLLEDKDPETKGLAMIAAAKSGAKPEIFAEYLKDADPLVNTYAHVASLLSKGQ